MQQFNKITLSKESQKLNENKIDKLDNLDLDLAFQQDQLEVQLNNHKHNPIKPKLNPLNPKLNPNLNNQPLKTTSTTSTTPLTILITLSSTGFPT